MFITPISFVSEGTTYSLPGDGPVPLPPWSGVPVALELEAERGIVAAVAERAAEGQLVARDEEGRLVWCAACVDPVGSHTCESDSFLVLIQCGPFEPSDEDRGEDGDASAGAGGEMRG